jgi:TPR repeat protein
LSADQGNAYGQNNYGHCLERGRGIPIDLTEAARYYKLSADQGDACGQHNYGHCLEQGRDISIDLIEAAVVVSSSNTSRVIDWFIRSMFDRPAVFFLSAPALLCAPPPRNGRKPRMHLEQFR